MCGGSGEKARCDETTQGARSLRFQWIWGRTDVSAGAGQLGVLRNAVGYRIFIDLD